MKVVEYQHRCEGGGNDVRLECSQGWKHGELVLIVSKSELRKLASDAHDTIVDMMPGVRHIAFSRFDRLNELLLELERLKHKLEL